MKRTQTKSIIANTLIELMRTHDIDKITVTDLAEKCGVSRQTFYYHFQDITDVLEWIIKDVVHDVVKKSVDTSSVYDSIYLFIKNCQTYHAQIGILLRSNKRAALEDTLIHALRESLGNTYNSFGIDDKLSLEEKNLLLDFMTYGIIGFIFDKKISSNDDIEESTFFIYKLVSRLVGSIQ